jgi:hypothetical protein
MENWKIARYGQASKGKENTRINKESEAALAETA